MSLLEYRNRSRNRLSIDLPRPVPPNPATVVTPASAPSSTFSSSVIKSSSLSTSLPNLSVSSSSASSLVHRSAVHSGEIHGPRLEPVSPDLEDKSSSGKWIGWFSNRTGTSVDDGALKSNNWVDQYYRVANWAPEVEFSPFRALSRRQMTFPFCC